MSANAKHSTPRFSRLRLTASTLAIAAALTCASAAMAAGRPVSFDIRHASAADSLMTFARQANVQVVMNEADLRGLSTTDLRGRYAPAEALRRLIGSAPIEVEWIGENTIAVRLRRARLERAATQPVATAAVPVATTPVQEARLEEIVVTAQRREQRLQDVPVAVTAISAAGLAKAGITSTEQLGTVSPGLTVVLQRTSVTPYLRGVGTQAGGAGQEGSVVIYVDGVYYASAASNVFTFNNIDRIEVLRGPQGTLFGRNATGGLIHVITREPSATSQATLNVGYGNYDTFNASIFATGPLTDTLRGDISMSLVDQRKGWGKNLTLGNDVNLRKDAMFRSRLLWEPTESFSALLTGDYSRVQSDMGNTKAGYQGARLTGGYVSTGTIYDTASDIPRVAEVNQWGLAARLKFSTDAFDLTSLTAYRDYQSDTIYDQDTTPQPLIKAVLSDQAHTFQQEVLFIPHLENIDLVTGAFFYSAKGAFLPLQIISPIPAANTVLSSTMSTKSYAAFAQGTYHFNPVFSATLGARFTRDERKVDAQTVAGLGHPLAGSVLLATANLPRSQTDRHFEKLTWRAAIEARPTDDILAYASFNRGFKSGTFNTASPYNPAVPPEVLDAFALGFKSEWLDRTLRLNAEAFHYDYSNIQMTVVQAGAAVLLSAARARSKGVDVEVNWTPDLPVGRLNLSGNFSVLDSHYRSFPAAPVFVPWPNAATPPGYTCPPLPAVIPAGGNRQCSADVSGQDQIRAPHFTSSVTADYSAPISNHHRLGGSVTAYHNSGFLWEPDDRLRQKAYDLVNAQLYLADLGGAWQLRAFVNNLTKTKYYVSVGTSTFGDVQSPAAPRTYGVSLSYNFGE